MAFRPASRSILAPLAALCLTLSAGPSPGQTPAPASAPTPPPAAAAAAAPVRSAPVRPAQVRPAQIRPAPVAAAPAVPAVPAPPGGVRLARGQPIPAAELEAFVDGTVRDAMAAGHVAGVAVAVVQNGQVVLEKGYGFAHASPLAPVDPRRTLFRLGSISKTFTWLAVLKAAEAGKLNLDQPVNAYLPPDLRLPDEGFDTPVRLRHLMAHTGGFEDRELGRLFVDRSDRLKPLAEALDRQRPHRVRAPGELSTYSNYGAALAGEALANTAGRDFESLVETEVLLPMGLADTTFRQPYEARDGLPAPMPAALATRLSDGFLWTPNGRHVLTPELAGLTPAVAASGTAGDMARYMTVLLANGATELGTGYGPQTAERIRTTLFRPAAGLNGWDHGFMEYSLPGGFRGFGHDGATLGFRSALMISPDLNLGVFVAGNTDTADGLTRRLAPALVQRFYAPYRIAPALDAAGRREAVRRYAGLYLPTRRAYHGLEGLVDRMTRLIRVSVSGDGRLVIAQGRGARLFAPDGAPARFRAVDGDDRTAFLPADGRAHSFFLPSGMGAAERVEGVHQPDLLRTLALLALAASLLVLAGLFIRGQREGRETRAQTRAGWMEVGAAGLWLAAGTGFGCWTLKAADAASQMYRWPSLLLVVSSVLGVAAALMTVALVLQHRKVWAGERRVVGWTAGRKLRHTLTILIYLGFAVVLTAWGALEPWSS